MDNIHHIRLKLQSEQLLSQTTAGLFLWAGSGTKVVTSHPVLISQHFYRFRISHVKRGQMAKRNQGPEFVELLVLIGWRILKGLKLTKFLANASGGLGWTGLNWTKPVWTGLNLIKQD